MAIHLNEQTFWLVKVRANHNSFLEKNCKTTNRILVEFHQDLTQICCHAGLISWPLYEEKV